MSQPKNVKLVSHPLFLHKLSLLRDERVRSKQFRELVAEMTSILGLTATETLDLTTTEELQSPLGPFTGVKLKDRIGIFPIMRAGSGMVSTTVHHLGLFREKASKLPVEYYNKLPAKCHFDVGFILDPVVATAGTAIAAVNILKDWGLPRIVFCSLLVSRDGLEALANAHPDIEIVVGNIDEHMNDDSYIYPGIGDAGDRLFKTK